MPCAVLFDLDDTLFDHSGCARTALAGVHERHACFRAMPFDAFERAHSEVLELLHLDVLAGRTSIDDARRERFRRLFGAAGADADDEMVSTTAELYRSHYIANRRAIAGAAELLEAVGARARVAVVTNNLREEQAQKLRACGIDRFVDVLMVSEEAGVSKPDPAIFRMTLERLGCAPEDAVMIGDSWTADVEGARAAGIRPIWFNPAGAPPPDPAVPVLRTLSPPDMVMRMLFDAHRD